MNINTMEMIVQLVISLFIVLGMIWLLVKFLSMRTKWIYRHTPVKVLGGVGLGPQKSLQLVEIGGVLYVLGIGQDVTLLRIIDDAAEKERVLQDFAGTEGHNGSLTWLKRFRRQRNPNQDFTAVLRSRLHEAREQRAHTLGEWLDSQQPRAEREKID